MSGQAQRQLRRWAQEAGIRRVARPKSTPTFKKWRIVRGDTVSVPLVWGQKTWSLSVLSCYFHPLCTYVMLDGDVGQVQIVRGAYKGDQGKVVEVHRKQNLVTVEGTKVVSGFVSLYFATTTSIPSTTSTPSTLLLLLLVFCYYFCFPLLLFLLYLHSLTVMPICRSAKQ